MHIQWRLHFLALTSSRLQWNASSNLIFKVRFGALVFIWIRFSPLFVNVRKPKTGLAGWDTLRRDLQPSLFQTYSQP